MADKYSFIVVKYPAAETGELALSAVVGLSKEKLIKLKDAVAITKTEKGKLKLHQTKDDGAKKGFLKGGAIGVLFALLLGPAGWIVAGAALGHGVQHVRPRHQKQAAEGTGREHDAPGIRACRVG